MLLRAAVHATPSTSGELGALLHASACHQPAQAGAFKSRWRCIHVQELLRQQAMALLSQTLAHAEHVVQRIERPETLSRPSLPARASSTQPSSRKRRRSSPVANCATGGCFSAHLAMPRTPTQVRHAAPCSLCMTGMHTSCVLLLTCSLCPAGPAAMPVGGAARPSIGRRQVAGNPLLKQPERCAGR